MISSLASQVLAHAARSHVHAGASLRASTPAAGEIHALDSRFYASEALRHAAALIGAGCGPVCAPPVENSSAIRVASVAMDGQGVRSFL